MPGVIGWILFPTTVFMWIIFPLNNKIILPLRKRRTQEKQAEKLRVMNMKEDYYTKLQKEHNIVLKQLDKPLDEDPQANKDVSKGV